VAAAVAITDVIGIVPPVLDDSSARTGPATLRASCSACVAGTSRSCLPVDDEIGHLICGAARTIVSAFCLFPGFLFP